MQRRNYQGWHRVHNNDRQDEKSILLLFLFVFPIIAVHAEEYKISFAAELSSLPLTAGDKVILKDGSRKDQQLIFDGTGTEKAPIVFTTENWA